MQQATLELNFAEAPEARQARRRAGAEQWSRQLFLAIGDGSEWDYRGECCDLQRPEGKCACGHQGLRYLFTIHRARDGKTAKIGSTCINHFSGISAALVDGITADRERLEKAAAERIKAAKATAANQQNAELLAELSALLWSIERKLAAAPDGARVPHFLWWAQLTPENARWRLAKYGSDGSKTHPAIKPKPYKIAAALTRWLKGQIAAFSEYTEKPFYRPGY